MKRRTFLTGSASVAAATIVASRAQAQSQPAIKWRLQSSFPRSLDTIFNAATLVAKRVSEATEGRFEIQVFAGGEIVPALGVLSAVGQRTIEAGHSAGFYYFGQDPALIFDTGVPFGMTPRQHNAWLRYGGGSDLIDEAYARFNVRAIPCGNTGAQMAGWFRKEIKGPEDLSGLKMRVAGFGGKVLSKLGVVPQQIPGGDIYPALERGTIDAVEWVGPYDDEKLGFYKVAPYYYSPGVLEPGAMTSIFINLDAWKELPPAYLAILQAACKEAEVDTLASYDAKNAAAIKRLVGQGVKLSYLPAGVISELKKATDAALEEEATKNSGFAKVYGSWRPFREQQQTWFSVNDALAEQMIYRSSLPQSPSPGR